MITIGKTEQVMSKGIRIVLIIVACSISCALHAQVTISENDYDSLRNEIKSLRVQLEATKKLCHSKDSLLNRMRNDSIGCMEQITVMKSEFANQHVSLSRLRSDSVNFAKQKQKMDSCQVQADENAAKLANGRLYFRYDIDLVRSSIELLNKIKTESVHRKFSQTLTLLKGYQTYSEEIKSILTYAQKDSERTTRNKADEYKAKYIGEIKRASYYKDVYAKNGGSNWSIPYLDNIIKVAERVLQSHDPGHKKSADFTVLIEML